MEPAAHADHVDELAGALRAQLLEEALAADAPVGEHGEAAIGPLDESA